jgi:hypothetical protein
MNKRERMNDQIRQHGENLNRVFALAEDPDKLARKVHSLGVKAHKLSLDYCNGDIDLEEWENETQAVLKSLDKILSYRANHIPIFVNGDARGYALKIDDDYVREHNLDIHRDWGGYGILAPEFDGEV